MSGYRFDAREACSFIVNWIKGYFILNGNEYTNAIIGISGGKDSSVAAALCVQALGASRVIGVLMPEHTQNDIEDSKKLCNFLNIASTTIDIGPTVETLYTAIDDMVDFNMTEQVFTNTPARIRMTVLYAMAALYKGRVVNTCNMSEDYIGYSTKYGDSAGDFAPLMNYTVSEVLAIGEVLGLPHELLYKAPSDGMCGKTDEENLGFTYQELDRMLREGTCPKVSTAYSISSRHTRNLHKLTKMPAPMFIGKTGNILSADQDAISIFLGN